MSRKLKVKIAVLVLVAAASMAVMGVLLSMMQTELSLDGYASEMQQESDALEGLLTLADEGVEQNTVTFDEIYQSKAASVAFMANNDAGFAATDAKMVEYQDLLGVDNVLVVSRDGSIVAKAQDTPANFAYARFNQLRTVFDDGKPSAAVEVELPEQNWLMRYYAARIDDGSMVVVEQGPEELRQLVEDTGLTKSVLKDIAIGQHGYVFAVSAQDYLVEYHPNDHLVGTDAIDGGIDVADLEDGSLAWMELAGESLYGQVSKIGDTYYIAAVPESDMAATRNITVGVILFIFFAVMAVVIMYGIFVMREDEREGRDPEDYRAVGPLRYNKVVGRKAAVLSFVGFLAVLGVSFYMQTLFALSSQSVANNERAAEVVETTQRTQARMDELVSQYDERYLGKVRVAGYILDQNPSLANRDDLQRLADVLMIQYVFTYDGNGVMTATNSSYANFTLSEDPEDQSSEFRKLLQGADSVVQEAQPDEISGQLRQYIGVPLHDEAGTVNGAVQIGIRTTRLENLLETVTVDSVLGGVKVGSEGFAFAVSKDDRTFAYFPDQRLVGKDALEHGMTENQLKGGYCDYLTVEGTTYYVSSAEAENYFLYVADTEGELMAERVPLTVATGGVALVCLVVIFLLLAFEPRGSVTVAKAPVEADARMIDVKMPSGRVAKTESAASRWIARSFKWGEKTAEQKTATVVRWLVGVFVIAVFAAVVFRREHLRPGLDLLLHPGRQLGARRERVRPHGVHHVRVRGADRGRARSEAAEPAGHRAGRARRDRVPPSGQLHQVRHHHRHGVLLPHAGGRGHHHASGLGRHPVHRHKLRREGAGERYPLRPVHHLRRRVPRGRHHQGGRLARHRGGDRRAHHQGGGWLPEHQGHPQQRHQQRDQHDQGDVLRLVRRRDRVRRVARARGEHPVQGAAEHPQAPSRHHRRAVLQGRRGAGRQQRDHPHRGAVLRERPPALERDLNREMKLIFDKYDISIPFPQVVINQPTEFKKATAAEQRSADQFNAQQKAAARELGNDEDDETR